MNKFIDEYFNINKMMSEKREYKQMMARVENLPEEYTYVFKKIQAYMWQFTAGAGYDMMAVQEDLVELFESGAESGKKVLEVTGDDVAGFCEELLKNTKTYTQNWRDKLNKEIHEKVKE